MFKIDVLATFQGRNYADITFRTQLGQPWDVSPRHWINSIVFVS